MATPQQQQQQHHQGTQQPSQQYSYPPPPLSQQQQQQQGSVVLAYNTPALQTQTSGSDNDTMSGSGSDDVSGNSAAKRAAMAGQWRTPPNTFFITGGGSHNTQQQHQQQQQSQQATATLQHYIHQAPANQPQHPGAIYASAQSSQQQQHVQPISVQSNSSLTTSTSMDTSSELKRSSDGAPSTASVSFAPVLPPISQLPSSADDYAKALQEAYRRGAEAAAAMAAAAGRTAASVIPPPAPHMTMPAPIMQPPVAAPEYSNHLQQQQQQQPSQPTSGLQHHNHHAVPVQQQQQLTSMVHHTHHDANSMPILPSPTFTSTPSSASTSPTGVPNPLMQQQQQYHPQQQVATHHSSMPPPPPVVSAMSTATSVQQQQLHHPGAAMAGALSGTTTTTTVVVTSTPVAAPVAPPSAPVMSAPTVPAPSPTPTSMHGVTSTSPAPGAVRPAYAAAATQQRSMSLPDMSTYAAQQEEEKRQKRLARNRASARLRRLRKKNLVDAYETEVGILEKTLQQLQVHQWGATDNASALTEALQMDRGQQVLDAAQRKQASRDIIEQQLQFCSMLEELMSEQYVLQQLGDITNRAASDGNAEDDLSDLKQLLQLSEQQMQQLQQAHSGWEEEWTALQTVKASLTAMKENNWLWNEGVTAVSDQFLSILHKNQISKFLLWTDHNAEAIDELDGIHAAASATDQHGPIFSFGVESNPEGLGDD